MPNEPRVVVELSVPATDGITLPELASRLSGQDVVFGPEREVSGNAQLYFDLSSIAETIKSITAIITGVGGTVKLIEYLIAVMKKSPKKQIVVKVGSASVTVTGNDEAEMRSALETILKP